MDISTFLLILTIVSVFAFDFTNGFHDAADMVATSDTLYLRQKPIISTRWMMGTLKL